MHVQSKSKHWQNKIVEYTYDDIHMLFSNIVTLNVLSGGLPKKMLGRVGDTPLVGCGGYANTVAAASTTGHGESIMKTVLAWDVVRNIEDGLNPMQACAKSVNKMVSSIQGVGGVISLNKNGEFGRAFSSKQMAWASVRGSLVKFGLERGEEREVPF